MKEKTGEKTCFVISPIGKEESDTRKRADQVLKHIITPATTKFGYQPIRADEIDEPGIITSQVIQKIVDSDLVIADLSEKNPNVFYELAIRHAIKKPLIQIINKNEVIPFDVAATRIIHFDIKDLDSVDNAKNEIMKQIDTIKNGKGGFDNPISISLDLKFLKESGNPEERSYADIIEMITELKSSLINLERNLNNPERILPIEYLEHAINKINNRSNLNKYSKSIFDETLFYLRETIDKVNMLQRAKKQIQSNDLNPIKDHMIHVNSLLTDYLESF